MENKAILPTTPPSEIDSNSLEIINEFTFSFAESIDRVWTLIRDLKLLSSLSASNTFPIIDIKTYGETWVVGNIFEGNIMGFSKFCAKCIKNKIYPNYKKIKWHFTYEEQKIENYLCLTLYKNTFNCRTILLWKESFPPSYFIDKNPYNEYLEIKNKNSLIILSKIQKILEESSINLFQFEGCIIRGDMDDIWSFLIEPQKLKIIAPLYCFDAEIVDNQSNTIGRKVKIYHDSKNYSFHIITKIEKKKNCKKWLLKIDFYDEDKNKPSKEVTVNLIKINKDECYLSIFHEYKKPSTVKEIQELSKKKKYVLENLKDFLENYK